MLTLIVIISLILLIICVLKSESNDIAEIFGGLLGIIFVVSGIILFIMLVSYPYLVDKKLAMYQEENTMIEEKIKSTVRTYMEYEQETYKNLIENADLTTMLLKYPELNSNELVKMEIETYKENNTKIKELKSDEIRKSTMAWWLYFGH